jgi:predicted TPR repeat methyltransferase
MMKDRESIHVKAEAFFDELWKRGDPWKFETSEFEQAKYECEIAALAGRHYKRVLEIGCGAGWFTRSLIGIADHVVAFDISPAAIERARARGLNGVDFRVANIMEHDMRADEPWDLVVMNETICYLGWLYSFFEVSWRAAELFVATRPGGHLLMANTCGGVNDYLMLPWIIRTYHDLFVNVGYRAQSEQMFRGQKDGVNIESLISVFDKPAKADPPAGLV